MFYVYMFIKNFTNLIPDIPSFLTVEDLENALLDEPGRINHLLEQVVLRFILNLRPNTRNTSSELIPSTLFSVLHEFPRDKERLRERTVFWDFDADTNVMPLRDIDGGFWYASWDLKLRILRQLVDWQLVYSAAIRDVIDTAWQSKQKPHKKKADPPKPAPDAGAPGSKESLLIKPLGQDKDRTRFWAADSSPRLYISTNPWKITQVFECVSNTRDEYINWIEKLRAVAPPEVEDEGKGENKHWELIYTLELRVDEIEADLARVETSRKKLAAEQERAATVAMYAPRTRLRGRLGVGSDRDEQDTDVASNGRPGRQRNGSTASRNTSMGSLNGDIYNDELHETKHNDQDGWDDLEDDDVEEVDELQDDSSLIAESDIEEAKRGGRKRRRRASPPTRTSARKRPRRDGDEATKQNGLKVNGAGPPPEVTKIKAGKGQSTKFWYFEEGSAAPAKRPPEMLDDPDAMLKRRRSTKKDKSIEPDLSIAEVYVEPIAEPLATE